MPPGPISPRRNPRAGRGLKTAPTGLYFHGNPPGILEGDGLFGQALDRHFRPSAVGMARERAKRCHYERTRTVRGRHLWANRNPATRPEPSEQGRSVFELAGDEMDDLALALHLARYPHASPEHDATVALEEGATLSGPVSSSRFRKHHAGGRARSLAGDDEPGGMRAPAVGEPQYLAGRLEREACEHGAQECQGMAAQRQAQAPVVGRDVLALGGSAQERQGLRERGHLSERQRCFDAEHLPAGLVAVAAKPPQGIGRDTRTGVHATRKHLRHRPAGTTCSPLASWRATRRCTPRSWAIFIP